MAGYPKIVFTEEVMREGMQIESASIPVEDKVELLNALSETGLKNIVVGSFVSPKYTPQMKKIEEVLMWQPGTEPDAALEGTPDDPRFKYIKYDTATR